VVALLVCGSAFGGEPITQWNKKDFSGLSMQLVDQVIVTSYDFQESGSITATMGKKGGALTAPILYWKIVTGKLVISDSEHTIIDELTLIHKNGNQIVAVNKGGQKVTYQFHQSK